jgi:hypothetical protein
LKAFEISQKYLHVSLARRRTEGKIHSAWFKWIKNLNSLSTLMTFLYYYSLLIHLCVSVIIINKNRRRRRERWQKAEVERH